MDDINDALLPIHRGEKWIARWKRDWIIMDKTLNPEIIPILQERVDYLIERWQVNVHEPSRISTILNGVARKYNGLIYEENGVMMEIDLFNEPLEEEEESFLFGVGNSKIFNQYMFDHHPELLI